MIVVLRKGTGDFVRPRKLRPPLLFQPAGQKLQ